MSAARVRPKSPASAGSTREEAFLTTQPSQERVHERCPRGACPALNARQRGRIKELLAAIRDSEFRALYLEYDAAFEWSLDDPRLEGLADRTARWLASRRGSRSGKVRSERDRAAARLGTTGAGVWSPAWDRLSELARQLR